MPGDEPEEGRPTSLRRQIRRIEEETGSTAVAVCYHDYHTRTEWHYRGERWFHAASTIKVPVLLGVFAEIHAGRLELHSRVHVRNRFLSVVDGESYRVGSSRDANTAVHAEIGRTMSVRKLALHMISTSSNLATNLLVDLIGVDTIRRSLDSLGLTGVEFRRGVEDEKAYRADINNRVTAEGLLDALRLIAEERAFSPELSREMLAILHAQEFRGGIPAGLPKTARVAHKTGEISTVAHDAGIVYLNGRGEYVLVVLTEFATDDGDRKDTIAQVSRAVYEHLKEEASGDG
jgi:beta-lactamase class A